MHQHLVDAFVDATLRWHSLETNSGERWTHNGPRSDAAAAPLLLVRDTSKFGATSVNDVKLGVGGEREAKPGDTLFVGGETKLLLLWEPLVIVVPRSGRNPIYRCVRRMERFFDRANFIGPVVDCIEAKFCKQICV